MIVGIEGLLYRVVVGGGLSKGWKKGLNMRGRVGITCQM
jgi:hypothetical protein